MTVKRLEISNPDYMPENVAYFTIHSSHLDGRCDVSVYNANAAGKDVPIIVLMHGVYGSHWVWMHLGGAHTVYDTLKRDGIGEFVLVMPSDGGFKDGSGYLPLITQPGHDQCDKNYDLWIMEDVLNTVIEHTACLSQHSKVYLSGLSMGGYGALRLGCKYADRISGISAHSSVTGLNDLAQFVDCPMSTYKSEEKNESDISHWLEAHLEIIPPLRMDCGESDSLLNANIQLNKKLNGLGIDHTFETFPGGHDWEYWHKHVEKTYSFFDKLHYQ